MLGHADLLSDRDRARTSGDAFSPVFPKHLVALFCVLDDLVAEIGRHFVGADGVEQAASLRSGRQVIPYCFPSAPVLVISAITELNFSPSFAC